MTPAQTIKADVMAVMKTGKQPDLINPRTFASNLIFLYHTMKASEHLLEVALAASANDSLVYSYLKHHLEEERGHEKWLKDDLASVGIDVSKTNIPREAVEMCGSIYYLIFHLDPVSLLGYMLVMECFPMSLDIVKKLEAIHGPTLLRTARYHAESDVSHGADLEEVINQLSEDKAALVAQTAIQSAVYFKSAIDRLL